MPEADRTPITSTLDPSRPATVAAAPDADRFETWRRASLRECRADAIAAGDPTE